MDSNELKQSTSFHSAVMVLHELSSNSLILTKRSEKLRTHPGEICFPGGVWEMGDVNLYATALRELHEELGITANRVDLVKELEIERTLLGAIIHPWFARIESIDPNRLNPEEITSIISIPMHLAQDSKNYRELVINRYGHRFKSLEFVLPGDLLWGATARIMKQLCNLK